MTDTLDGAVADLEQRIADEKRQRYPNLQLLSRMTGRLAGLKQRQINHENMKAEIAKHMAWIEDYHA